MPKTVISVENLSKSYHLGQISTGTLSRDLEVWWAKVRGRPNPLLKVGQEGYNISPSSVSRPRSSDETLWALKDVSFKVPKGEVLGIIGRNGAGKSTLLKILSRVTAPTSGQVKVKGRIASLLEVGTGFHPELTGRENIFLNGAILGMSRQEVQRKFDEIVSFAEVEKFVDTPVKRYSSGMYVRLAFAVAAHLESEILLVDEVLAVGDAEFQKKCLGKMGEVAINEGRTVFFVSHNMGAVNNLCKKALLLEGGRLIESGYVENIIDLYLNNSILNQKNNINGNRLDSKINGVGKITNLFLEDEKGGELNFVGVQEPFQIVYTAIINYEIPLITTGIEIKTSTGDILLNLRSDGQGINFRPNKKQFSIVVKIPGLPIVPGIYVIEPWIAEAKGKRIDQIHGIYKLNIISKGLLQSEKFIKKEGYFLIDCDWKLLNKEQ